MPSFNCSLHRYVFPWANMSIHMHVRDPHTGTYTPYEKKNVNSINKMFLNLLLLHDQRFSSPSCLIKKKKITVVGRTKNVANMAVAAKKWSSKQVC